MSADRREFIKLDVSYLSNPKVADALDADPLTVPLHIESMTYCRKHRLDGVAPLKRLLRAVGADQSHADILFRIGLWHDLGDGQIEVHDYLEHQESAEEIAARSDAARKAVTTRWDRARSAAGSTERNTARTAEGTTERNTEERRGEERKELPPATAVAAPEPAGFAAFWAAYPRRSDKGHARAAYIKALKKSDPESLILGAKRYAATVADSEQRFIALPTTWLNGERWTDEHRTPQQQVRTGTSVWDRPIRREDQP